MSSADRRIRVRRPSHPTVVAYLALFVAMSGTAAATTYVVSSNHQIGPGTVSGANPPSGYHRNLVNNSITGADVKESTLGQVPAAANAGRVGGHGPSYFGRVIPLDWTQLWSDSDTFTQPLGTVAGLRLTGQCSPEGASLIAAPATDSDAGSYNAFWVQNSAVSQSGDWLSNSAASKQIGPFAYTTEGQAIFRRDDGHGVVTLSFHIFQANTCEVIGTAVTRG